MIAILIIVILIVAIVIIRKAIVYRNVFQRLQEEISRCKSTERLKRQSFLEAQKRVRVLARDIAGIDAEANVRMLNESGGTGIYIGGQRFPNYHTNEPGGTALIDKYYIPWTEAREELINKIADYNKAISMFPGSIFASMFGFEREMNVGEDKTWESINLEDTEDIDLHFDGFLK